LSLIAAVAVVAAMPAGVADATFPGRNGLLAVGSDALPYCREQPSIVSMKADGTQVQLLAGCAAGSASATEPNWAPDGRSLRFLSGGMPAVMAADGSDQRVISPWLPFRETSSLSISPEGREFLYSRFASDSDVSLIWRVSIDGTNKRPLGQGSLPEWSPDGRLIAYDATGAGVPGVGGIWVMNARTGRRVRQVIPGSAEWLDWAPGGRRLLGGPCCNGKLWIARVDGKRAPRFLRTTPPRGTATSGAVWSPDGRHIAFATDRRHASETSDYSVWTMSSRGTHLKQIHSSGPHYSELTHEPTLSWQPLPR
jgi:Tol biopolymer transport system component